MKFKFIFFSLFITLSLLAQRAADGEKLFNNKQYEKARTTYENLLKQHPNDALYNYRLARCCYELKDVHTAILHFEMSGNKYPLRDLYLAELYFNDYQFDKSVMAYQTYLSSLKSTDDRIPEFEAKIKISENAARLINKVEDIAIVDSIVVNKTDFLSAYKIGSELGSIKSDQLKLNSKKTVDKITYSTQREDRIYKSDSIKGQMDIFTSYKLLDEWSPTISVSKIINTSANENYPFLSLDGITLYFASDGENSIGGYDIFITRFNPSNNGFLPPENLGMPFNSPANDYMLVIDDIHKLGWFATDRNQPAGKVAIYTFVPNNLKTIIRSEDKEYIRQVAQLKKYRKANKSYLNSTTQKNVPTEIPDNQIEFVVNDSVQYTHIKDFKSENGAKQWYDIVKTKTQIEEQKQEIETLRNQYFNAEEETKKTLTTNILDLEKHIVDNKSKLEKQILTLKNDENNFISKNLIP
ncbi:MAG: tetratricopeptide repeat protein [Paludibacter sp.]|nr:tetratricopeptide repeat protein [Paludibacter sp.]